MVHVYQEAFGRGPTKARARMLDRDTLIILLEEGMTVGQREWT